MPVINLNKDPTIGKITGDKKKIKIKSRKKPARERKIFKASKLLGKKVKRICEPSNGGIGIKLKTAKNKLITTI